MDGCNGRLVVVVLTANKVKEEEKTFNYKMHFHRNMMNIQFQDKINVYDLLPCVYCLVALASHI